MGELHREGSAPAACTAGLFPTKAFIFFVFDLLDNCGKLLQKDIDKTVLLRPIGGL